MIEHYFDPDYTGGGSDGTAAKPWIAFNATAKSSIDSDKNTDNVTVYFSARAYASDTNKIGTVGESLWLTTTNTSAFTLTFDGYSKWNSDAATPSWSAYSGSSKYQLEANFAAGNNLKSIDDGTRYDNFTFKAFHVIITSGIGFIWGSGDNVTVEDCLFTQTTMTQGPAIHALYAYEPAVSRGANDGITIKNNTVHTVFGEGIYIGGCEDTDNSGHTNVLIEGNTVYNVGEDAGGEGDFIDCKDGIEGLTIRGNTLYVNRTPKYEETRDGIVTMSAALIEDNIIYGVGSLGISLGTFWNTYSRGHRDGTIIRNNLMVDCGGEPNQYSWGGGIQIGEPGDTTQDQFTGVQIYNNTIANMVAGFTAPGWGIRIAGGSEVTVLKNNITYECAGTPLIITDSATPTSHDYNCFYQSGGGTLVDDTGTTYNAASLTSYEANSISTDPAFVDGTDITANPPDPTNYHITVSSPAKDTGTTVTGLTDDYLGTVRPQAAGIDMGFYEYSMGETGPTGGKSTLLRK